MKTKRETDVSMSGRRGRPGRRSTEQRLAAVLEILAGKATVDQVAMRFGVQASTVEGWRADAMAGVEAALRRGTGKAPRELELEREVKKLRSAMTETAIEAALLKQALEIERQGRPTRPARSGR